MGLNHVSHSLEFTVRKLQVKLILHVVRQPTFSFSIHGSRMFGWKLGPDWARAHAVCRDPHGKVLAISVLRMAFTYTQARFITTGFFIFIGSYDGPWSWCLLPPSLGQHGSARNFGKPNVLKRSKDVPVLPFCLLWELRNFSRTCDISGAAKGTKKRETQNKGAMWNWYNGAKQRARK